MIYQRAISTSILITFLLISCKTTELPEVARDSSAQTSIEHQQVGDRLYLGRLISVQEVDRNAVQLEVSDIVTEYDWATFLLEEVTPRFPAGLTIWHADGQWRDSTGEIMSQPTFVLEIFHNGSHAENASIEAIATAYKKRFNQESVLRVSFPVHVKFY